MNVMCNMKYLFLFFTMSVVLFSCENKVESKVQDKMETSKLPKEKSGALIEISAEDLLKMLKYDKNAFVIDVRKADKNIRSCKLIEGYKHLEDSLVYKNPDLLPKGKTIVLLSKTGEQSRKLGLFLRDKGFTVYNLKEGMDSYWRWREQLIRDSLHIYDEQINIIELYADDFGC